ncbi:MAG: hypothetical protein AAGC62_04845 [Pseudomonadota bacterium]
MRTILIAATAALLAGPVLAGSAKSFERAELNNDGFVSQAEFSRTHSGGRAFHFVFVDRDNDGRLDRAEYAQVKNYVDRRRGRD